MRIARLTERIVSIVLQLMAIVVKKKNGSQLRNIMICTVYMILVLYVFVVPMSKPRFWSNPWRASLIQTMSFSNILAGLFPTGAASLYKMIASPFIPAEERPPLCAAMFALLRSSSGFFSSFCKVNCIRKNKR